MHDFCFNNQLECSGELTHMVYIADFLMSKFHAGVELEHMNMDNFINWFEKTGLSISRFQDVLDLIPVTIFESSPSSRAI